MNRTAFNSKQIKIDAIDSRTIKDGSIQIQDIDITTPTKSLITKVKAGNNITISSTGVDDGTGEVTINALLIGDDSYPKRLEGNILIVPENSNYQDDNNHLLQVNGNAVFNDTIIQKVGGGYGWRDLIGIIEPTDRSIMGLFIGNIKKYQFRHNNTNDELSVTFHLDHDYAMGTPIYPHIHWGSIDNNSGNIRWGFEYAVAKGHGQEIFSNNTVIYIDTSNINSRRHMVSEVTDSFVIPANLLEPDTLIIARIFRDINNETNKYNYPVFLLSVDLHYQTDRHSTKNRAPSFYI
jgi:hypothetical protein